MYSINLDAGRALALVLIFIAILGMVFLLGVMVGRQSVPPITKPEETTTVTAPPQEKPASLPQPAATKETEYQFYKELSTPEKQKPETPATIVSKPVKRVKPSKPKPKAVRKTAKSKRFYVQVASFKSRHNASKEVQKLKKLGFSACMVKANLPAGTFWRVRVGPYSTKKAAEKAKQKLILSYGYEEVFITR